MSQVGTTIASAPSAMQRNGTTTLMLAASLGLLGLAAPSLGAQDSVPQKQLPQKQEGARRLIDSIEAPYAYVSLESGARGAAQSKAGSQGKTGTQSKARDAVRRLLADPSLDALFAADKNSTDRAGNAPGGSSRALSLVRGVLSRGASELELAMTGIVSGRSATGVRLGQPLLVLRARLRRDQADRLRLVLEETTDLATPSRKVGGHQTYKLRSTSTARPRGPGDVVEMAMVGDDLVVGNDDTALREVLEPLSKRTTTEKRRVLSNDPRFRDLHSRLDVPAGSLVAYGDWQRLGRRLQSSLTGVPAQLLASSGLGSARSVMMAIAPAKKDFSATDFSATLLLEFELDVADTAESGARNSGATNSVGIDGWFAATEPVTAKKLLRELPRGGLGGLVLSVDLAAVAAHSPRSSHMVWDLRDAYTGFGLDFDRNVLARLASRGTVQLHFGKPSQEAAGESAGQPVVTPVYSLRAKSRTAAEDLFDDLRRVVESTNFGAFETAKDAKGKRLTGVLHLHGAKHQMSAWLCVHNDSVLFAESRETVVQVYQELRRSKPRGGRDQFAGAAIKSIGGESVAGLFDLDLDPLFQRFASALPGADLSALPKRHIGYLDTDRRDDGAVVRIRVLSSR